MAEQDTICRVKQATLAMQRYSWEQGVVAQAFLESGERDATILLALEGAHRQTDDGRCAQIGEQCASTDPCAIGEALVYAFRETGDPLFENALAKLLQWSLKTAPRNAEGIVYHLDNRPQFWVDSLYMLPPFLASAGHFDAALQQIDGYWNALFLPDTSLLAHMWDDQAKTFIRRDAWGVGNGWALAGLARVIACLPTAYAAQRGDLINRLQTLLDAVLKHQRADALFHDVLDNPGSFVETNAAQMVAYTIYRGIHEHYLSQTYLPAAQAIYYAVGKKVDQYGIVQDVCGSPLFNAPGSAPEGQAFYLLMNAMRAKGSFG